jgi:hypothetical protein
MDENNDTMGEGHGTHRGGDAAASELQSAAAARSRSTQWILRGSSLSCLQPGRCKTLHLNCFVQK